MISIILLSYQSSSRIADVLVRVSGLMEFNGIPYEFIIIDDGSKDDSFNIALALEKRFQHVRAYQLSKNYTSGYAAFAGLSVCKGECATIIPDDEQLPYQLLVKMYNLWQNGTKMIIPFREKRNDGLFTDFSSMLFYRFINSFSEVKFPTGGADSFLIDRELIDIINARIHPINTYIILEILRLGFDPFYLPYEREKGINPKSRWTFKKKSQLFLDVFFTGSTWPIRVITLSGLFLFLTGIFMIIFYVYLALIGNTDFWHYRFPGWTSTVIIMSFFSGVILFSLGIIAEYIWRVFEEVKNRPGYIIKKKDNEG